MLACTYTIICIKWRWLCLLMQICSPDNSKCFKFNPIQDGPFWDCLGWWSTKRPSLPKTCHTYPTIMKLATVIPYLKKIQTIYESSDTPLEFCWHKHFHWKSAKSANFAITRNTDTDCIRYIISNYFISSWVFKDCFNKYGYNFDNVCKMATLGLLKIKLFWNKGYDIIISVHDVTNKISSCD